MKPGDRAGAICDQKGDVIRFFGFGVYEGDFVPGKDPADPLPVGWVADMRLPDMPNPRIRLDNGDVVWGCECWWGSEARVAAALKAAKRVVTLDVKEIRKQTREQAKG